ncbi:hypothetical protein ACLBOM_00685 [Escherichia coli]
MVVFVVCGIKRASRYNPGLFPASGRVCGLGSNGKLDKCPHGGPFPGVITQRVVPSEKLHMTAKPVQLMAELV